MTVRLFELGPQELAGVVYEAYLADQGEFNGTVVRDYDTLLQLRGYLGARPSLAELVLQFWLQEIKGEEALNMKLEAQHWYDFVLLSGPRAN